MEKRNCAPRNRRRRTSDAESRFPNHGGPRDWDSVTRHFRCETSGIDPASDFTREHAPRTFIRANGLAFSHLARRRRRRSFVDV